MGFCGFISRTACFLLQAERQEMESDPQRLHYCSAGLSRTRARTHTCTWNKISKTSEACFKRYAVSQRTSHQAHIYRPKLLFTTGSRFYLQNRGDWVAGECHGSSGDFQFIKTVHKYHIVSHLGKCPAQR